MPSNDDMKHQSEEERKGGAFADAPLESVMLDDHGAGADETCTDEVSSADRSSEHNITQESRTLMASMSAKDLAPSTPSLLILTLPTKEDAETQARQQGSSTVKGC